MGLSDTPHQPDGRSTGNPSPGPTVEFMKVAVLSPSQRYGVQLSIPKDWKLDPESSTQPVAWISPDQSSIAIVFSVQKGGSQNLVFSSLTALKEVGAEILAAHQSEDFVGIASTQSLRIHAKMGATEFYEQGCVISRPECDFQVKIIHSSSGKPVTAEAVKLVDSIRKGLDAF